MGIISDAALRRQFVRHALRGLLGLSIAAPVIAVIQGQYLLSDFRENHRDAPFPAMPCSGVVVVHPLSHQDNPNSHRKAMAIPKNRPTTTTSSSSWFSSFPLLREQKEPDPLRLLVVGDSLAAGVGVTKSGTPVLPEAIAKSLSSALGGRAVYWTCMGEPGLSSPQIVKELLLAEKDNDDEEENSVDGGKPIDVMDELKDWWQERRRQQRQGEKEDTQQEEELEQNVPESVKKVRSWWKKTTKGAEKDFQELRHKIRWKELGESVRGRFDISKKIPEPSILLPLRRRNTEVPDLVSQYDVAVVITGFNDIKNLIFPLPKDPNETQSKQPTANAEGGGLTSNAWFERDLFSIMRALRSKMRNYGGNKNEGEHKTDDNSSQVAKEDQNSATSATTSASSEPNEDEPKDASEPLSSASSRRQHPMTTMVVFPATPLFADQIYPLSFFANPVVAYMDYQKKKLAEKYPAPVLFLEGPKQTVISDYLNKRGPLWEARSREEVLFELTNKARLEQLETMMKEYYIRWTTDVEEAATYTYDVFGPDIAGPMQQLHTTRSPLISPDNVHPSDEGYELWGRHIAEAIVKEWDREESPSEADTVSVSCTEHNFDGE